MNFQNNDAYITQLFTKQLEQHKTFTEIVFEECTFESCNFSESIFQKCTFINCLFNACDLSVIKIPNTKFTDVLCKDSKVIGIDWTTSGKIGSKLPLSINFQNCILNYSSFYSLNLTNIEITNCTASEVDFAEANLSNANCRYTDFQNAKFLQTNLSKADFRSAKNYMIDPKANTIKKAKFSLPEALTLLRVFDVIID